MEQGLLHLYWGDGKGKTTAAMGLALRALGSGKTVVIVQFLKGGKSGEVPLLEQLGAKIYRGKAGQKFVFQMNDAEKAATRQLQNENLRAAMAQPADLLILDDLGTEYISQLTISVLYELINTRMLCHRPTIYTSNIVDSSIFEARYTEKVASRILGSCQIFKFFGTDQRLKRGGRR